MAIKQVNIVGIITNVAYSSTSQQVNVVVNGEQVQADGDDVVVKSAITTNVPERVSYLTEVLSDTGVHSVTFAEYRDPTFYDWKSVFTDGVDTPAFLVTGYLPQGDYQRNKSITYATFHLQRTEDIDGEPSSSALISTAWDWNNSHYKGTGEGFGNRWSREFQAYRYPRRTHVNSHDWSLGESVISSRNKIRGSGKVFSFHISTEPGKDCRLHGWSLVISGNGNV